MGTNYYWYEKHKCEACDREYEPKHIGKSSAGWVFGLHIYPNEGIYDLNDWLDRFQKEGSYIVDEYGSIVSVDQMIKNIADRQGVNDWKKPPYRYESWAQFHSENHSFPGPKSLLRRRTGKYCSGHGSGTWDLIEGEFS